MIPGVPMIRGGRTRAAGALLATLLAAVFAFHAAPDFATARTKLVRSAQPFARTAEVSAEPSDFTAALTPPFAAIWRVRNETSSAARFALHLDGRPVCDDDVPAQRSRRLDCAVSDPAWRGDLPHVLTITGPPQGSLEYLELASHHGGTGGLHRLWFVPRGARAAHPRAWLSLSAWAALLALYLLVPPAPLGRRVAAAHRAVAGAVLALCVVTLVAPFATRFEILLAPSAWLLWAGLATAPRLAGLVGMVIRALRDPRVKRWAAPVMAVSLAVAAGVLSAVFGIKTAGGSDHFGYVSQAYLWTQGSLIVSIPPLDLQSVPNADRVVMAAAYTVGPEANSLVPAYPPGLPLMMAGALLAFGTWGPFLVVPLSVAAAIFGTFALGRRVDSTATGLMAAVLLASSPAFIYMAVWPMSDVPVAALWTLCLWSAVGRGRHTAASAGALAGLAVLVRPNLALLATLGASLVWRRASAERSSRGAVLAIYALAAIPALALLAWFNTHVYGSPLRSGYGPLDPLFDLAFVMPNARNYSAWFVESQGIAAAVLGIVALGRALLVGPGTHRVLALFAAAVVALYLPYVVFDPWWFLRFLLPAYPPLLILIASMLWAVARRAPRRWAAAAAIAMVAITAAHGLWFITGIRPHHFRHSEHRFAAAGQYVRAMLPDNAAFISEEHSGSLRFYAGRLTIRYDLLSSGWLAPVRAALEDAGYSVYLLIDENEIDRLRARFIEPGELAFLDQPPVAEIQSSPAVRIYAISDDVPPTPTVFVDPGRARPIAPANRRAASWEPPR